jgi:hypothetical protein
MTTTVQDLVALGLLHDGATSRWTSSKLDKQNNILDALASALETDVTRFIACSDGALEAAIIRSFCTAAGIEYSVDMRVVSGEDFGEETAQTDPRHIDLIVKRPNGSKQDPAPIPVIAIEAKFTASVHARWGYCPNDREAYSNQIICYPHGCVNPLLDASKSVAFVWLAPERKRAVASRWGKGAIVEKDREELPAAYELQKAAESDWKALSWQELIANISASGYSDNPNVQLAVRRALRHG